MHNQTIHFTLNDVSITCTVPPHWSLHDALRTVDAAAERPDPCPAGDCCRCTVLLDGRAVCACHVLAHEAADRTVRTRGGLTGHLVLQALLALDGPCGSCIDAFALAVIDHLGACSDEVGTCVSTGAPPDPQCRPGMGWLRAEFHAERRLEAGLRAIPCTCDIEPQVRQIVRRLMHSRRLIP